MRNGSAFLLAIGATAAVASCNGCPEDDSFGSSAHCLTTIDSASSPVKGALTFYGHFYPEETLILQQTQNSAGVTIAQGTPATERTSFTLTGLPSGTISLARVVSCQGGQDKHYGFKDYFIL